MPSRRENLPLRFYALVVVVVVASSVVGRLETSSENEVNGKVVPLQVGARAATKCEEYSRLFRRPRWFAGPFARPFARECERRGNFLVVGGRDTEPGEFPHMAALGWRARSGRVRYMCGGSLVSERWILTAAHCAIRAPRLARLGGDEYASRGQRRRRRRFYEIIESRWPDEYAPSASYADIALLRLSVPVVFDDRVKPACLRANPRDLPTRVVATGWGATVYGGERSRRLMAVPLRIVDEATCAEMYGRAENLPRGIGPGMICAGDPENNWIRDTCQGDSGGPLQTVRPDHCLYEVIGVTSFGRRCAIKDSPGVYTRVTHYLEWIEDIVWPDPQREP